MQDQVGADPAQVKEFLALQNSTTDSKLSNLPTENTYSTEQRRSGSHSQEYPLKPGAAIQKFKAKLTDHELGEILDFKEIYYAGQKADKVKAAPWLDFNNGFDDERGDYDVRFGDHISYRFELKESLGKGSFGQCIKCWDHKNREFIALKIIRNKKKFYYQANVEVNVLKHLRDQDPEDNHNIIRMKEAFLFRSHLCVTFELLSLNLYDFLKLNDFEGLSMGLIRRFAI